MIVFNASKRISGASKSVLAPAEIIESSNIIQPVLTEFTVDDVTYDEQIGSGSNTAISYVAVTTDPDINSIYLATSDTTLERVSTAKLVRPPGYSPIFNLDIIVPGYATRRAKKIVSSALVQTTYNTKSFTAGCLSAHCREQALGFIAGHTSGRATQEYMLSTSNDVSNPSVTINDDPFISQFDFSGVSVLAESGTLRHEDEYPAILINPRYGIISAHVPTGVVGQRFTFKRLDGNYQTVTVADRYTLTVDNADTAILKFDTEVTGCTIYDVMPEGWEEKRAPSLLLTDSNGYNIYVGALPIVRKAAHLNDEELWVSAIVINHISVSGSTISIRNVPIFDRTMDAEIPREWGEDKAIGGDSGGPSFIPINDELVLICAQTTPVASVNFSALITEINAAMNNLATAAGDPDAGTYALNHPDLSEFTDYTL